MQKVFFPFWFFVFIFMPTHIFSQTDVKPSVVYLTTWGENETGSVRLKDPQGISVDPAGFIYIADTGNQRIVKINPTGRFVTEVGGFGWKKEEFNEPVALSARDGLDVFVADYYNQRIVRYDKDLHYIASFISSEEWPEYLRFGFPKSVDISSQGELFCLDDENSRVLKLNVKGNPQLSFGGFDAGEGRLQQPQRLLVSGKGKVCVSDWKDSKIVVFDTHGNYLYSFGKGILEKPVGIGEVGSKFLLVADVGKKKMFIFKNPGEFLMSFAGAKIGKVSFGEPIDVACWRDRIYVLDKKRNAVDVFRIVIF